MIAREQENPEKIPKAFISYSWDDDDHKKWVAGLAAKLRNDGIDVTLDQWDLVLGDALAEFMEKAIRENDFVLIICTPNYRLRSDNRTGGVGYEGDIMTAEVIARRDHRKFIPVLAGGRWEQSAPSWLKGKVYVDLGTKKKMQENFSQLTATLHGNRAVPPPVRRKTQAKRKSPIPKQTGSNEPIRISRIIKDEITTPKLDGTPGSALYAIPFQLNRSPSTLWANIFINTWDRPPVFSSMHSPGIARVSGDKIILDGTTIDEVKQYHRNTLELCIDKANEKEMQIQNNERARKERERKKIENHRKEVEDGLKDLSFD